MEIIRKKAYARMGLIGNPSDGYHGKTISVTIKNFWAEVTLYEWPMLEILRDREDSKYRSLEEFIQDVRTKGYYGGVRLVKATIKRFFDYCQYNRIHLSDRNFSVRFQSNIPRQVGLAGSSAIVVATLRCLMEFYKVEIPMEIQPSLALSVEKDELGISAGLQDRVVQVYEGLVHMDFTKKAMRTFNGLSCGVYEKLDTKYLPSLYMAYNAIVGNPTEVLHDDLRYRYEKGEVNVIASMLQLVALVDKAKSLLQGKSDECAETIHQLIDANFDIRRKMCCIPPNQIDMAVKAHCVGASAKFTGSGGAIVGVYSSDKVYEGLVESLSSIGCVVLKPIIH